MRSSISAFGKRFSLVYLIFALILASALTLGRYSYRNARQLNDQGELSLIESNRLLGEQTLNRIDNFIIDSDRSLFDLVDLEHLQDFARRWSEIVRLSEAIESAVVLDENYDVLRNGYVSKRSRRAAEDYLKLFKGKILQQLPLGTLKVDSHKHLHVVVDGRDYLISFIKREQRHADGSSRMYYVALNINLEYLRDKFFPEAFANLRGRELFAVLDGHNRVVFGDRLSAPKQFLYEAYFPTTLYLWRLQMAPPEAARIAAQARARRFTETGLIFLMMTTILVGMGFLAYAVNKERRTNQLKSDFIANVSHELKTPLSLIRMFAELLSLGKLKTPEKSKEYADIITREASRLSQLIDNVLDLSRIERGKAAYDFKMGDLGEVIVRAVDVYRHRIERESVKLNTQIEESLPETLLDENGMTLVVLNLIDNAVKYGGEHVEVVIGLQRVSGALKLTVTDNGPGIPRDEQKRIFDRFYRARAARGKHARGSGIGLALVKYIVESHSGKVTVESELGKGTCFSVTMPLRREHKEETA